MLWPLPPSSSSRLASGLSASRPVPRLASFSFCRRPQSSRRIGGSARPPFIPTPPVRRSPAMGPTVLPAIDQSVAATVDTGNDGDGVPDFAIAPASANSMRTSNATVYGITI